MGVQQDPCAAELGAPVGCTQLCSTGILQGRLLAVCAASVMILLIENKQLDEWYQAFGSLIS